VTQLPSILRDGNETTTPLPGHPTDGYGVVSRSSNHSKGEKRIRGLWIILAGLACVAVGAAAGLAYAWLISPVRFRDTAPLSLAPGHKDAYRLLVAASYEATGDLERARRRLALLADPDPARPLAAQAQRIVAAGGLSVEARQLALLAAALGPETQPGSPAPAALPPGASRPAEPADTGG
jgi:hypothetical protein